MYNGTDMDKFVILNYELPIWYPWVVFGLFLILLFLHRNNYEFTGNRQIDRTLSVLGFILLFGSELVYFVSPNEVGTFFYYMNPEVVGWGLAIIAFIMTFVVIIAQFFWYLELVGTLHDSSYSCYSNFLVTLLIIVLLTMKIFGIYEDFLDEYMLDILEVIIAIHVIIITIQNFHENTSYMILLEVPLFLLGILASLLISIVAVCMIFATVFLGKSDSSEPSSSDESEPPKSCKECHFYDIAGRHCRYYDEDKDAYSTGYKAIYHASSCPDFSRR